MKNLKEFVEEYSKGLREEDALDGYKQGFIDATKLAAENAKVNFDGTYVVYKPSILKAIEE